MLSLKISITYSKLTMYERELHDFETDAYVSVIKVYH
jgi:hypothetical protein